MRIRFQTFKLEIRNFKSIARLEVPKFGFQIRTNGFDCNQNKSIKKKFDVLTAHRTRNLLVTLPEATTKTSL